MRKKGKLRPTGWRRKMYKVPTQIVQLPKFVKDWFLNALPFSFYFGCLYYSSLYLERALNLTLLDVPLTHHYILDMIDAALDLCDCVTLSILWCPLIRKYYTVRCTELFGLFLNDNLSSMEVLSRAD